MTENVTQEHRGRACLGKDGVNAYGTLPVRPLLHLSDFRVHGHICLILLPLLLVSVENVAFEHLFSLLDYLVF